MARHLICADCETQVVYEPPANPVQAWIWVGAGVVIFGGLAFLIWWPLGLVVGGGLVALAVQQVRRDRRCPSCHGRRLIDVASPAGKRLLHRSRP